MARRCKQKLGFVGGHSGTTVEDRAIDDRTETLRGSVFAADVCHAPVMLGGWGARHGERDEAERADDAYQHNRYFTVSLQSSMWRQESLLNLVTAEHDRESAFRSSSIGTLALHGYGGGGRFSRS